MPEDKRTKMGPTGPVRPVTGTAKAVAAVTPAAVTPVPGVTPAPTTDPPGGTTSYLRSTTDPMLGQVLAGRYLIQKKLGEGGMGAVYLATHNVLEKQVALKVLHGEFARKPDLVERFMGEAKAASRIRHENVIDISDFGTTPDGMVFFAMELLHGHDLHEEIARARLAGQLLPWERSKKIFLQICAALSAAHGLGIIHRDLKPENIYLVEFLGEPDFVKLLDFGIAKMTEVAEGERKLTRTGMLFGTPEYMSPEQARGDTVDHRVDVYAMGCILFQLVTGRVPFEAENFMGVLSLHLIQPPPAIPPEVFDSIGAPRALAAVIERALAKDRNQRFATIDELARAVRHASGDRTGPIAAQANVQAPAATAQIGRARTQWTGNLSIPESDAPAPKKSRLPLIVGAVVLVVGAAAAAAVLVTRTTGSTSSGSAGSAAPTTPAPGPAGTPSPGPGPGPTARVPSGGPTPGTEPAFAFKRAQVHLDSSPTHAEVKDLATGTVLGPTPLSFPLEPSRTARQFKLHLDGYVDTVVEIVPDRERINETKELEKGVATAPVVGRPAPTTPATRPPKTRPGLPTTRPEPTTTPRPGSPAIMPDPTTTPPVTRPDPVPPATPDPDIPTLKPDPSRSGSGSASGTP